MFMSSARRMLDAFNGTQATPWWWEWAPRPQLDALDLPPRADVLVVGSGYTGLMAALTLARGGRKVVVAEAEAIGHGASSRNGGQVGSGNQRFTVAQLKAIHGPERARALLLEGTSALDFVKSFVQQESIDCHFRQAGRFRGASRPEHYEAMARDMEDLRALTGVESHVVPRDEQHVEIGSNLYHGGTVLPADASLHPALYHAGLVERAEAAGVQLLPHTRVTGIQEQGEQVQVNTVRGVICAKQVLVATNGYTSKITPELHRRVIPVGSAMIATQELSPNLMAHLMPKRRVFGDTLRIHHYYQASPDGLRILFGGRLAGQAQTLRPKDFVHLYRDMVAVFPELDGVQVSHAWSGYVGYTKDTLPHLGRTGRIHHAMGYCGSGIARASHGGHQVGLQMLGSEGAHTAWNDLPFEPMPFRRFARLGVQVATTWKRFQDTRN
jgi:glycine/D-amino acid oxidase-like deaminating enzyme